MVYEFDYCRTVKKIRGYDKNIFFSMRKYVSLVGLHNSWCHGGNGISHQHSLN